MLRLRRALPIAALLALAATAPAAADDRALVRAAGRLDGVELAHRAARVGDSARLQAAYDAARDLAEAVRAAGVPSVACRPLADGLRRTAAAVVAHAEGVDRPLAGLRDRGVC